MQNYTKYEKCLDTPIKPLYYYSNTKKKDLRMENLRILNIYLSDFFWQIDNDTILFLTVSKNKIAAMPVNIGVVAILTVVLNYSILFSSFTFFLDGFHLAF